MDQGSEAFQARHRVSSAAESEGAVPSTGPFGEWAKPRTLLALVAAWFLLLALFNRITSIDTGLSWWMLDPACIGRFGPECPPFPLYYDQTISSIRAALHLLPGWLAAAVLVAIVLGLLRHGWRSALAFDGAVALAALVAGPLLLVNGLIKDAFGRPRPMETDMFGGTLPFVAAGDFTAGFEGSRSFVSGESAAAAWIVCLIWILPPAWRPAAAIVLLPIVLGWMSLRIVVGSHYLSDVVLGALSTFIVFSLMAVVAVRLGAGTRRAKAAP